jgi:ribosomal-protein-alanine N-acetyltransferase
MLDYFVRNREFLAPTSPAWPADFFTLAFMQQRVQRSLTEFETEQSVRLFLFDQPADARILGSITFDRIQRAAFHAAYLGYALDEHEQRKGLMGEALAAAIHYMFRERNLHRIMANYMPTNPRSGALLRRFGFVVEGYARDYLRIDGQWRDHILTSLTNPDWKS